LFHRLLVSAFRRRLARYLFHRQWVQAYLPPVEQACPLVMVVGPVYPLAVGALVYPLVAAVRAFPQAAEQTFHLVAVLLLGLL
jgi:hypothetical protein